VLGQLLDEFAAAEEYLFDSVHQVRMDRWHDGRVVLVGDAAWCLTLYSGMGASAGLAGSELLGNMLEKHPTDLAGALRAWEEKLRPFIARLQLDALKMRMLFTPSGVAQRVLRATILRLFGVPVAGSIAKRLLGNDQLKSVDIAAQ
jgi:2-polyprenyl-6-methoxyphenol hydroxylase-like FAD-dependent oxidoreductase